MDPKNLSNYIAENKCTILAVGPISKNCVDAVIELSQEHDIPIILIASRNQIDSEEFGGGYVNNWTTESFSSYVRNKNGAGNILLARDHGGPWQNMNEKEKGLSLDEAMASAKRSYKADIDAGFNMLHIDPSIDIHENPSVDQILDRVFELYEYCMSYSAEQGKEVIFEIGTEEQSGFLNSNRDLQYVLNNVKSFCSQNDFPEPSFVVVQTGTKVKEMKNIGRFEQMIADENSEDKLKKNINDIVSVCNEAGIMMKTHNMDYLSEQALNMHASLGIHAANVAPEFGVTETITLLSLLNDHSMPELAARFTELSYQSGKWNKWMLENTDATDSERAVISGHYTFAIEECKQIKKEASESLMNKGIVLDEVLTDAVKQQIIRYLKGFRVIK